jgi:hypothetical protein
MITSDLTSAGSPLARPLPAAREAGALLPRRLLAGTPTHPMCARWARHRCRAEGLAALARDCGIEMGFHNHETPSARRCGTSRR